MMQPKHSTIIYRGTTIPPMDVMFDDETAWLTLGQMSQLFGRDMSVIGKHVKNVFSEGELPEEGFRQILPKSGKGRPESVFALDVVISVGYRVKSVEGVRFRQECAEEAMLRRAGRAQRRWRSRPQGPAATKCLREIMLGKLRRELANGKVERRIDSVEHRLTQVENGLEIIVQQLSEDPDPFLSKDRKMIGFNVD